MDINSFNRLCGQSLNQIQSGYAQNQIWADSMNEAYYYATNLNCSNLNKISQGFSVRMLQFYNITMLLCYIIRLLQFNNFTMSQCYKVTLLGLGHFYSVTMLHNVTVLWCYNATKLPCYIVVMWYYRFSILSCCDVTTLQY